jgi:hypothetical protein
MMPHSTDLEIKGKVEIQKMRRLPKGYPFFEYYFGGANPYVQGRRPLPKLLIYQKLWSPKKVIV